MGVDLLKDLTVQSIFAFAAFFTLVPAVSSAETVFSSYSAVKQETVRLGKEAADVAATPFDLDHGGLWGTLAVAGMTGLVYTFDDDIRSRLQDSRSSSLDKAAKAGSFIGNPFFHLGVAAAVYGGGAVTDSARYKDVGLMLGEAAILADASTFVLKQAVGRSRPFTGQGRDSFRPFQFRSDFDSFPSMHAASSFAMASVIAGTSESLSVKLLSYGAAFFVGFSRMYEDKHWASDVVLGAAIGELCGRVVMNTHVRNSLSVKVAPVVSPGAVTLAVLGHW